MMKQHQRLLAEVLEIHNELERSLGKVNLDRLAQLSSAILVSAALERVAESLAGQRGEKSG